MISLPRLQPVALDNSRLFSQQGAISLLRHHLPEALALVSYVGVISWIYSDPDMTSIPQRIMMVSGIYLLVGMYWLASLSEGRKKALAWGYVADQTGLTCQAGRLFSGYSVNVFGTYRGRELTLGTEHHGIAQIQSTVIRVAIRPPRNAKLSIRGPFSQAELKQFETIEDPFEAALTGRGGRNGNFYVESSPYGMVYNLYQAQEAWDALEKMPAQTTIEIRDDHLTFQQMIQLCNPADVMRAFDLLCDLADALEQ